MKLYSSPTNQLNSYFQGVTNAFAGATPKRDATGRIIGWDQPNLNKSTPSQSNTPVQNSSGVWVDPSTGQPAHGTYQDGGVTKFFSNGQTVNSQADVGTQKPYFDVTQTQKNPTISGTVNRLATQNDANTGMLTKSFNDYLAEANRINSQAKDQLAKDQQAYDTTGTENRINTDLANQSASLNQTNQNYASAQNKVLGDVAATNQDYAKTTTQRLADLKAQLDAQNQQYETAAQNVANQAYAQAQRQNSLYHLGTGTPTSGSGNLDNRYIRAYNEVNLPLQQDLAARRYSQSMTLNDLNAGAQHDIYGNTMNQYAGQSALNTDLANRYGDTTKYTTGQDVAAAQYIQQLRQSVAGMSRAQAQNYLQSLALPVETIQQIMSSQIANTGAVSALDQNANWYTVSTPFSESAVPATPSYGLSLPARSYTPAASAPAVTGGNDLVSTMQGDANAAIASSSNFTHDTAGNLYQRNQTTGQWMLIQRAGVYPVSPNTPNSSYLNGQPTTVARSYTS